MNRKQLILVLLALAVVGSAGLVLLKQHHESWNTTGAQMGDKVLPAFRPNDVSAIHIKGVGELEVVHRNDVWRIPGRFDYPANFGKISDLLLKLQNLKVVESETVAAADLPRVDLDTPGSGVNGGTLIEFKDAQGKVLNSILLGKKHLRERAELSRALSESEPDGRYILLPDAPGNVLLISDALGGVEPRPDVWLSRDFIKVERIRSVSLASTNDASSWKMTRDSETSPWTLQNAQPSETLNTFKANQITNVLAAPAFNDVAPVADATSVGLDKPMTATIETFDQFVYTIKTAPKGGDDKYHVNITVTADLPAARTPAADETPDQKAKLDKDFQDRSKKLADRLKQEQSLAPWIYTVNSWILDPVFKDRSQMLQGAKEDIAPQTVNADTSAPTAPNKPKQSWTPRVIQ